MKSLYQSMMLVAAAAMSITACTNDTTEDIVIPAGSGATKTITVTTDITRTEFADANRTQLAWSANDKFGVFTDAAADKKNIEVSTADGSTFSSLTVDAAATTVYAYYPRNTYSSSADKVRIDIPQKQTQTAAGVFNGAYMPMIATGTINLDNSVALTFKPVACALALNICKGQADETVTEVTFTTASDSEKCSGYDSGGNDITVGADKFSYKGYRNSVTLTVGNDVTIPADGTVDNKQTFANQIYMVVAKKSYKDGAKFVVKTTLGSYTFTTTKDIDCTANDFMPITLDLSTIEVEAPVTYTRVSSLSDLNTDDTYIIAGNDAETFAASDAMQVWNGTVNSSDSKQLNCVKYTVDGETLSVKPSTIAEIKLETTGTANTYYIKVGDKYLYNASGTSLSMSQTNKTAWTIADDWGTSKEGMYFKSNNCSISCNSSNNTALRAYASSKYKGIYFFKKEDPNAPKLTITSDDPLSVSADGGTQTITYTTKNLESEAVNASVPADASWITNMNASVAGTITFDVEKNEGSSRSTTVTITCGTITKTVTVKQAGTADAALGKAYSYTFTAKVFAANEKKSLGDLPWTLAGEHTLYNGAGHWGYSSDKGQQFGSSNAYYKNMTLTLAQSDYEAYSPDSQAVQVVKVNTSGASSVKATLVVTVGGVQIGEKVDLTQDSTEYTFTADSPLSGDVVLTYKQTSSKALYIKSISINNQ